MKLEVIDFDTIKQKWISSLWVGREDVKPMSSMVFGVYGEYDMSIYSKFIPTFWGIYDGNELVAVNSGFRTEDDLYRSRGLWVDPSYRGKNLSQTLFEALFDQARLEGCVDVWSFPKYESIKAYERAGFQRVSAWITEADYGVNCYALKNIELAK